MESATQWLLTLLPSIRGMLAKVVPGPICDEFLRCPEAPVLVVGMAVTVVVGFKTLTIADTSIYRSTKMGDHQ